ncbi:hypothetical protein Scep_011514 [Stephania cephalantha]|uniref:Protein kinase domain-containing protein n=1 Tax=Stephania cephalantha TaxID=152367 RepID=A0AAP0JEZ1_9MAGN
MADRSKCHEIVTRRATRILAVAADGGEAQTHQKLEPASRLHGTVLKQLIGLVEVKQIAFGAHNTTISLAKPRSPKPTTINASSSSSRWTKSSISLVVEEQDLLGGFQLHLPRLLVVKYAEIGDSDFLQRQREAHRQFQGCPQIIRCYGDECTALNNGRMIYSVLFEHASGGNLADLIKTYGGGGGGVGGLAELDVKSFAKSILLGLDCIHKKGYAHLDIKPKNILLVRDSTRKRKRGASASDGLIAKIGDFWIAKSPKQISREIFRGNERSYLEGTPRYMSP